jgi:hypothetical protein
MQLLLLGGMFFVGWFSCRAWLRHRVGYYVKQLGVMVAHADALNETNELLVRKLERLEEMGIEEDPDSFHAKVDEGIFRAIKYKQKKAMGHN